MNVKRIVPCLFALIIDALGFGLVYPVMTAIFTDPQSPVLASDTSIALRHFYLGIGFLLYPLCMFFGTSFMGDLSDNYGRRRVLVLCLGGIFVSFCLMGIGVVIGSLSLLFIGRALSGLMAGSQPIAQAAVADLSTPEDKARNMGFISLSYSFGCVLGPFIGGVTSDKNLLVIFQLYTPFFVAAVLAILGIYLIMRYFKETFQAHKHKLSIVRPIYLFVDAFKDQHVRFLALVFMLMQVGYSIFFQYIIVRMRLEFDYSNSLLGLLTAVMGAAFGIGSILVLPPLTKMLSTRNIAIGTLFLTGVFQIATAWMPDKTTIWILTFVTSLVDILAFTTMLTLFSDSVSEKSQGWVMGIASAVIAASWAFTGLFSNLISFIGASGILFIGGLSLIASFVVLLRIPTPSFLEREKNES